MAGPGQPSTQAPPTAGPGLQPKGGPQPMTGAANPWHFAGPQAAGNMSPKGQQPGGMAGGPMQGGYGLGGDTPGGYAGGMGARPAGLGGK